jgi:hypothetical protein
MVVEVVVDGFYFFLGRDDSLAVKRDACMDIIVDRWDVH